MHNFLTVIKFKFYRAHIWQFFVNDPVDNDRYSYQGYKFSFVRIHDERSCLLIEIHHLNQINIKTSSQCCWKLPVACFSPRLSHFSW